MISASSVSSPLKFDAQDGSIEDLEWSPQDASLFSACSTDGFLRMFDVRSGSLPTRCQSISQSDVNVLSWNRSVHHLIATGDDNGEIVISDLRMFGNDTSSTVASFRWHRGPISSIQWNPKDATLFAASGLDDQVTLWDLSLEEDYEEMRTDEHVDVPAQLLFVHQGQRDIKEVHWHGQIPGLLMSTAADGFTVFKTINS
jgi:ribosome assembly protein RRB1